MLVTGSLSESTCNRRRTSASVSESPANLSSRQGKVCGAAAAPSAPAPTGPHFDIGADLHLPLFFFDGVAFAEAAHADVVEFTSTPVAAAPEPAEVTNEPAAIRHVVEEALGLAEVAPLVHQRVSPSAFFFDLPFRGAGFGGGGPSIASRARSKSWRCPSGSVPPT